MAFKGVGEHYTEEMIAEEKAWEEEERRRQIEEECEQAGMDEKAIEKRLEAAEVHTNFLVFCRFFFLPTIDFILLSNFSLIWIIKQFGFQESQVFWYHM